MPIERSCCVTRSALTSHFVKFPKYPDSVRADASSAVVVAVAQAMMVGVRVGMVVSLCGVWASIRVDTPAANQLPAMTVFSQ